MNTYQDKTIRTYGRRQFIKGVTTGLVTSLPVVIGLIYVIQVLVDASL